MGIIWIQFKGSDRIHINVVSGEPDHLPKEFREKNLSGSYSYNEMQNERKV